jgi:hypothetical protein
LDRHERALIGDLQESSARVNWREFSNLWMPRVNEFYSSRGLRRREIRDLPVYRIAQDLASRLSVSAGVARPPDYRDELEEIIRARFRTRREFCKATGLSEDMLSHVLSRRKHLAVGTLAEALERIGYALRVVPLERVKGGRGMSP